MEWREGMMWCREERLSVQRVMAVYDAVSAPPHSKCDEGTRHWHSKAVVQYNCEGTALGLEFCDVQ